jgi:deoxyribodipyrimidine photo-lyase
VKTAIWWIRRDLRLSDNQALVAALQQAEVVIPVFILDERLICAPTASQKRLDFLFDGLRSLDKDLKTRGSGWWSGRVTPWKPTPAGRNQGGWHPCWCGCNPFARQRDKAWS